MRAILLLLLFVSSSFSFMVSLRPRTTIKALKVGESEQSDSGIEANEDLVKAMKNARNNAAKKSSPGAGLDAFESAEAAYADLINTSMDQRKIDDLSEEELLELSKGGTM